MIDENSVYNIYDKFGLEDSEVVIEEFNKMIKFQILLNQRHIAV